MNTQQQCTEDPLLRHIYKESPPDGTNRGAMEHAQEDKDEDPHVSQHAKDKIKWLTGGVDRPLGSAEPGMQRVQVHLEESWPRHLITFHMCIWREPTSRAINRASLPPSTHTLSFHHSKKARLSLALLAR